MSAVRALRHAVVATSLIFAGTSVGAEPACPLGYHDGRISEFLTFVLFEWNAAAFDRTAVAMLNNVAKVSADIPQCPIWLIGHADRSGPDRYNLSLSKRRAEAVAQWLRRHGVRAEIHLAWWGESRPLVETSDGVREIQNRRVEITMDWTAAPPRGVTVIETPRR